MTPASRTRFLRAAQVLGGLSLAACAPNTTTAPAPSAAPAAAAPVPAADATATPRRHLPAPVLPADVAFKQGWMPLEPTGVPEFAAQHPTFDGRGVLIAILDSGIDPGIPGLITTSTGDPKILDLRDFSGEGQVALTRLDPSGDTVVIGGQRLGGFSHLRALDAHGPWYGGTISELAMGDADAGDLNADGDVNDTLAVVVLHATDGWVMVIDANGNGSLADDKPVHDYLVAHETFGWSPTGAVPYLTLAANIGEQGGKPTLDLFFDTSAHGSHVSGIAAGHDLYGVKGFDGVAPGAQLIGCKIADDAHGAISRTGSMLRALDYAIRFAATRHMPLVVNMSFGVGNEVEGQARIDHLFDSTLALHPDVVFMVSAGNDGPGLSTLGFPGTATRVIPIGALFPGIFLAPDDGGPVPPNSIADFSARGGEVAGPEIVTPGVAYSTVPLWNRGGEREGGTSMASPHAAGLAARLLSGAQQDGKSPAAWTIRQALMVTAQPLEGATFVDEGTGLPNISRAWSWLHAHPEVPFVAVTTPSGTDGAFVEAASGKPLPSPQFSLQRVGGKGTLALRFQSSVPWIAAPSSASLGDAPSAVPLRLRDSLLARPGAYVGVVSGWGPDTALGPLVRLVTTVVVPYRDADITLRQLHIAAGQWIRIPFSADSGRPFSVHVSSDAASPPLAYLHEPGGMPYRDNHERPAGKDDKAAIYDVLSGDAQRGTYELVVQASPFDAAVVNVHILQSPVRLTLGRAGAGFTAGITNISTDGLRADVGAAIVGVARAETVTGKGSTRRDLAVDVPEWARGMQVDVTMARQQWARYTDFGVSLFDTAGHQLVKTPLNYAFGRLEQDLDAGHGAERLIVSLFPGFADPADSLPWSLNLSIRFYSDSAQALAPADDRAVTLGPGESRTVRFTSPAPHRAPAGYLPIGLVLARTGEDEIWGSETILPAVDSTGAR